jgi:DHA1 family bicyclomycin/chloramphenicol resistance-like MFS transporter
LLQNPLTDKTTSRQFNSKTMLVLVALLTSFPMLSTDLYLPAIPLIQEQLNTTVELVNLTLVVFFIFMSISTLICGPLSDRFGRKPVLLYGVALFLAASVGCTLSGSIYTLILARIFQAVGAGAGLAISSAIVKDFFPPEKKAKVFALAAALVGFVPIVAPVIGAQMLRWMSWRGTFAALSLIGLVLFIFVLLFKETNHDCSTDSVPASILRLFVVLKNPAFARLIALFSLTPLPLWGYVGISAILYIQVFGLSEQQFSLFFAANALVSVIAPFCYLYLSKFYRPLGIITASIILSAISGVMIVWIGGLRPVFLMLSVAVGTFAFNIQRPPLMNLILDQQEKDTGSASALMNSFLTFIGSFGLYFISQAWTDRIRALGMMFIVINIVGLPFWLYAKRHCRT